MSKSYLDDINPLTYQGFAHKIGPKDGRQEGWRKQRDTQGFDETYLWDFNTLLIKFILPKLILAVRNENSLAIKTKEFYPHNLTANSEKALGILEKIVEGFELYVQYAHDTPPEDERKYVTKKIAKAQKLFWKHFDGMWY